MKVLRTLLGIATGVLSSTGFAADQKRPGAGAAVEYRADSRPPGAGGAVKAIHLTPHGRQVVLAAKAGATGSGSVAVDVFGPAEVLDGDAFDHGFSVTAGDDDLPPFTVDLEYSEGLSPLVMDLQGWACTFGAPGHATCDWPTPLLAGETTGTVTFQSMAQPPYGGTAVCDPGRSPCLFLRGSLTGVATGVAFTAVVVGDNHPPVAVADSTVVPLPAGPIQIDVLQNDTDQDQPSGDILAVSIVDPPVHGTAAVDSTTQHIVYTPGPGFVGSDELRYRVTDVAGASATALVTVGQLSGSISVVSPVTDIGNVEPGRVAFRYNHLQNTTGLDLFGSLTTEPVDAAEFPALLAGTGYDPSQAVSDTSVFQDSGSQPFSAFPTTSAFSVGGRPLPPVGRVWLVRVRLTLRPVISPSVLLTASHVIVMRSADVSEAPVHVIDDAVTTPVDTPILIHPLGNDDSAAGLPLSVTGLAWAEPFRFEPPFLEGGVQFADGPPFLGALYTPPPGFVGTTTFYYAASETPGGITSDRYDYAKVTVTVGGVSNRPPVAHSLTDAVRHDGSAEYALTALASDADGDPLTVTIVTPPSHGTATVLPTGGVRYEPSAHFVGPDSFQFVANDGQADSNVGTVTITVTNAAPVLGALTNLTVPELSPAGFTASATDPEGDAVTFSLVGAPAGAQIGGSTGVFAWTPTESQGPGTYTFTVRVTDTVTPTLFDEQPITVTVTEVNAPPALALPSLPGNVGVGLLFGFTATATDPDIPANGLQFSLAGAPAGASIGAANGVFAWTPRPAQGGVTYTFAVVVTDNGSPAATSQQSITITVDAVPGAPTLLVSSAPDRSNPQSLGGGTLNRLAYIFVSPSTGVTRVRFWLDDPARTGPPRRVESLPPFDFAGTAGNGSAQPLDTRGLPNGPHLVSAEATLSSGATVQLQGAFTVANTAPALLVSLSPDRSNPRVLGGAVLVRSNAYVFVLPDPDAVRVRFWLDAPRSQPPRHTEVTAPYDFEGTAANGNAAPFNTRSVNRGLHVIRAVVDYPGGVSVSVAGVFLVTR
jgi:hypothetical protein